MTRLSILALLSVGQLAIGCGDDASGGGGGDTDIDTDTDTDSDAEQQIPTPTPIRIATPTLTPTPVRIATPTQGQSFAIKELRQGDLTVYSPSVLETLSGYTSITGELIIECPSCTNLKRVGLPDLGGRGAPHCLQ